MKDKKKETIDFELDYLLYGKIEKFSAFFCMKTSHFIQMLITVGIQDYNNGSIKDIFISKIGKEEKEKLNEYNRKLYQYSDKVKIPMMPDETEDDLDDLRVKMEKEKKKLIKRGKITLSKKTKDELDVIYNLCHRDNQKVTRSDIISSLLRYEISNRVDYLTHQYKWGKNLIEDDEAKEVKKVNINIPNVFYDFLYEKAEHFNISVDDYIKILIEQTFCQNHQDTIYFLRNM